MTDMIRQTDRAFGLTFATVFTVIFGVVWWVSGVLQVWLVLTAGIFLFLGLAVPGILLPLNRLWAAFAARLSVVSNHLLLGAFFVVFILPTSLIMRLIGRDLMHRNMKSTQSTYWTPVNRQTTTETLPDMF